MSVSKIKPWFVEDISQLLRSVYFSMSAGGARNNPVFWSGVISTLTAIAIGVGIEPTSFLTEEDLNTPLALEDGEVKR